MRLRIAIALVCAGSLAHADPAPDLRVKSPPVVSPTNLMMRAQPAAPPIAGPAVSSVGAGAEVSADATSGATVYKPLPTDIRDIEERVIFKLNVGYGVDSAPTSGDPLRSGFVPDDVTDPDGNALADQRQYLLGDAVLGTRGVLLSSMHTYFLSQFQIDADGASRYASLNNVYDERDGRALLVYAGYAEINDVANPDTVLGKVFLRAGRQFRYGNAMFITNFDGVTAGYDSGGVEVSGFFGRRVSLFFGDDPGLLGGAGLKLRLQELANIPVDLAVDYLFFDGGGPADETIDVSDQSLGRQYVELSARAKLAGWRTYARARLADNGDLRLDENGEEIGRAHV